MKYSVWTGHYLRGVGKPVFLVAVSSPGKGVRVTEHYVFIYGHVNQVLNQGFRWGISEDVPADMISDDWFLAEELGHAKAHYEHWVSKAHPDVYNERFSGSNLEATGSGDNPLIELHIYRGFRKTFQRISEITGCTPLAEQLKQILAYPRFSREDFRPLEENED